MMGVLGLAVRIRLCMRDVKKCTLTVYILRPSCVQKTRGLTNAAK